MDSTFQFLRYSEFKGRALLYPQCTKDLQILKANMIFQFSLKKKKKVFKIRYLILGTFNIQTKCMLGIQVLNISLVFKTY